MTEIRPIKREEADDFLLLLCDCFDLDFARARNVFFREPMYDPQRKWALVKNGRIESILTTVPLAFGWGNAIGIAGVGTRLESRGKRYASELLQEVLTVSGGHNEGPALLFAKRTEIYERAGFKVLDEVIRAPLRSNGNGEMSPVLEYDEIETRYNDWARLDPSRLRRDSRRWDYWKWNLRVCSPLAQGYLCLEGGLVRECIPEGFAEEWPIAPGTEWLGLRSMARQLGAPILDPQFELYLMGYQFDAVPQMFMTDQF